jgi:ubiquinone/menaquinone biosynthesis C-methylase UbiE
VVLERSTRGLRDLARLQEDELYLRLWLPGSIRSLLDVAGGHGGYSVAFCRRYPQLTATVIELAETVKIGRTIVDEEGLSDRVQFVEGDATTVPLGGPHDVAFFFNLAHHLSEAENRAMFRRIAEVLRPGGAIVVMEMFADLPTADRFMVAAFGLYFQRTSGARIYTSRTVAGWLEAAGYERVWIRPLRSSGGVSGIVVGRRVAR